MKIYIKKIIFFLVKEIEKLQKLPALLYIFIYLAFIFLFAFIYTLMPNNSFYHSTAKYEKNDLSIEADLILNKLNDEITKNFDSFYKSNKTIINGWEVNSERFKTSALNIKNYPKEVTFLLGFSFERGDLKNKNKITSGGYKKVSLSLDTHQLIFDNLIFLPIEVEKTKTYQINGLPKEPTLLDIIKKNKNSAHTSPTLYPMTLQLYGEIINFGKAYLGFPSKIRNHYSRMLYFSASIATSNGLGDIVPITEQDSS